MSTSPISPLSSKRPTVSMSAPDLPPGGAAGAILVHIYPPGATWGFRFPVGPAPVIIGRDPGSTIVSEDQTVSARHARIEHVPGGAFQVIDQGSTNGTFINEVRIACAAIQDRDQLRVGASVYRFLCGPDPESQFREETARLATLDPGTGLPKGPEIGQRLRRLLQQSVTEGWPVTLVLIELDQVEGLVARFGEAAGNGVMCEVGVRVRGLLQRNDTLGRLAMNRFAALLPWVEEDVAEQIAERFRAAITEWPFPVAGEQVRVTASTGVAVSSAKQRVSARDLFEQARDRLIRHQRESQSPTRPLSPAGKIHPPESEMPG